MYGPRGLPFDFLFDLFIYFNFLCYCILYKKEKEKKIWYKNFLASSPPKIENVSLKPQSSSGHLQEHVDSVLFFFLVEEAFP